MSIPIVIDGETYDAPSSALDTNWATAQIALEQALAAGVNTAITTADAAAAAAAAAAASTGSVAAFPVTANANTIPSTTAVVILSATGNADFVLSSTPPIQAGTVTGQRLQLFFGQAGSGSVTIASASGFLPSTASFRFQPQAAMSLIWDGTDWSELTRVVPYDVQGQHYAAGTAPVTDPATNDALDVPNLGSAVGGVNTIDIVDLAGDVVSAATPALTTGVDVCDGTEVTIINRGTTHYYRLSDNATVVGSALRLSTTTITLKSGSSVRLRYSSADVLWYEVGRAVLV